jgi:transposase
MVNQKLPKNYVSPGDQHIEDAFSQLKNKNFYTIPYVREKLQWNLANSTIQSLLPYHFKITPAQTKSE